MPEKEHSPIIVINDAHIAVTLQADRELGEQTQHILDLSAWGERVRNALVIVFNTAGRHASHGINPHVCVQEYHDFVREILGGKPPHPLWQPAALIDCNTEESEPPSRFTRLHERFFHSKSNAVSRRIGAKDLTATARRYLHWKQREERHAQQSGNVPRLSKRRDRYLNYLKK
jgi:hypothetical protein